jgi:hypothetical protein
MIRTHALYILVLGASLTAVARAEAQSEPTAFGERGTLILTADRLFPLVSYTAKAVTVTQGETQTITHDDGVSVALLVGREPNLGAVYTVPRLAFDFTVLRRVTLGASMGFTAGLSGGHTEERSSSTAPSTGHQIRAPRSTSFGFGPRIGYVVPATTQLSVWARAGFAFSSVHTTTEQTNNLGVTSTTRITDTLLSVELNPQVVWQPIPHVLLGVGPLLAFPVFGTHDTSFAQGGDVQDRSDSLSLVHVGLNGNVGAWFDL